MFADVPVERNQWGSVERRLGDDQAVEEVTCPIEIHRLFGDRLERSALDCEADPALQFGDDGARSHRQTSDLVQILHGAFRYELDMWLVMHKDLRNSLRMRLLFDHLAAELAAYVATSKPR